MPYQYVPYEVINEIIVSTRESPFSKRCLPTEKLLRSIERVTVDIPRNMFSVLSVTKLMKIGLQHLS